MFLINLATNYIGYENLKDKNNSRFMEACKINDLDIVKDMLLHKRKLKIKIDAIHNNNTIFIMACKNNYIELAKLLIDNGADIYARNDDGDTALILACKNNYIELAKLLINNNFNVNLCNNNNKTAIFYTCLWSNYELSNLIIKKQCVNIHVYSLSLINITSKFHWNNDSIKIIELLIEYGANVNVMDNYGNTLLFNILNCITDKNIIADIFKQIVKKGANIHTRNHKGESLLILYCGHNNYKISKFLIKQKIEINTIFYSYKEEEDGCKTEIYSALKYAYKNKNYELMKLLIENGADINMKYEYNKTLLLHACEDWLLFSNTSSKTKMILFLLDNDANVNIKDSNNNTPLLHLMDFILLYDENDLIELIEKLIEKGANINSESNFTIDDCCNNIKQCSHDKNYYTPLIKACKYNKSNVVYTLIYNGGYVDKNSRAMKYILNHQYINENIKNMVKEVNNIKSNTKSAAKSLIKY